MDELELLKQGWKRQEDVLPKLSYKEIYQMILKKSSSIVKWIFVISIIEFLLWASLDIIFRVTGVHAEVEKESMGTFSLIASILSYVILIYFIIRFYLNYKKIQSTDSTKVLMENIIRTRRTVKQYIWINISFFATLMFGTTLYMVFFTEEFQKNGGGETPIWLIIVVTLITIGVFVGIIALFYRLIYGILTRRLKRNYKELEKLEI
ncbi:hypothetical protein U6A24_12200 [Aquimarina gracilis]|uniref:Uncharacterized protein n=1 Tax=Aquimarina gracilis TaxID=874422 RepID=A0ABU5ZWK1_9FLAO|nr:hypothetical protein [Aquimarina gracilis]MEB3346230.1 hypothetical protein [Aquimarina gracilis]